MPTKSWPARRLASALGLLLTVCVTAACSGDSEPRTSPPQLTLSMTQLLPHQGSRVVLLRVDNEGPEPVVITGAGLRWSGYGGEFVTAKDDPLGAGERLDLRLELPGEQCDGGDEAPVGLVRTTAGTVARPLTESGQGFVQRLWARRCFVRALQTQVSVTYGDRWHVLRGGRLALEGDLVVRRRAAGDGLRFTRALGSVLHSVALVRPVAMAASQKRLRVPVRMTPNNRCDEHAIGQATAPYAFKYGVELGDAPEDLLVLTPPQRLQERIAALLLAHCRRHGGVVVLG